MTAALAAPAMVYLFLPPKVRRESEWVDAGDITKLQLKTPVELIFRKNLVDGWKISSEKQTAWAVKVSDQKIVAFGPQCTHLGSAPRPLDRYETKVENGKLLLGALHESSSQNA
jgi:menaquinol-cytochrome c reductase iron-sulfur subunit